MFSDAIHFQPFLFIRLLRRMRVPNLLPVPVELRIQLRVQLFTRELARISVGVFAPTFVEKHLKELVQIHSPR